MVSEELMREALEGQFTTYVGNPCYDEKRIRKRDELKQQEVERRKRAQEVSEAKARAEYEAALALGVQVPELPAQLIMAAVALAHGLPLTLVLGPSRCMAVKEARHHMAWELKQRKPSWSLSKVGVALNKRDHTTVINSIGYVNKRPSKFAARKAEVERLLAHKKS